LKARGLSVVLLSGDRPEAASRLARELGMDRVIGGATPEQKRDFVRGLQAQGAIVAMVGDGINDAPVLAQAQVSIALGSGTSLARAGSDMVLMSERLDTLVEAHAAARRTMRIIYQNLAWALGYNAVALPLAVLGYVTPLVAAVFMSSSSLLVVLNALRLTRRAPGDVKAAWCSVPRAT
jgi:P-type Cu2+ transporter